MGCNKPIKQKQILGDTLTKSISVTPLMNSPPYQILPHTHSYFHCLYSYLDLLSPGAPEVPQGGKAPLVL